MVIERQTKFSWSIGFLLALHWYCVFCFSIAYLLSIFSIIISIGIGGRMLAGVAYFVSVLHFFINISYLYQYWVFFCISIGVGGRMLALGKSVDSLPAFEAATQPNRKVKRYNLSFQKWKDITHLFKSENT